MESAAAALGPRYRLRTGKCVYELTPAGCSIRTAIESFMSEAPFAGRTPVFVGDEDTDEEGFDAVNALGGCSIRVGSEGPSVAQYRFATVSGVVGWLRERNTTMMRASLR